MPNPGNASAQGATKPARQVSSGLGLWLELEDPARMSELLAYLADNQGAIQQALRSLHYVHFSRFLPTPGWDKNPLPAVVALQVITEFDGEFDAYVLDFAMVIGDQFERILSFVKGWPGLSVKDHPAEFLDFIRKNNVGLYSGADEPVPLNSAYPDRTVIDIIGNGGLLPSVDHPPAPVAVDRSDVQANVLQGLNMAHAVHLGLRFNDSDRARAFLAALLDGGAGLPQVSSGARWAEGVRPASALTVGLSYDGLRVLGLHPDDDAAFNASFRTFVLGPDDERAAKLNGDVGASRPLRWRLGGPRNAVHLVVSVYADDAGVLTQQLQALRRAFGAHSIDEVAVQSADVLADPAAADRAGAYRTVHFGYADGLSHPRLAIADEPPGDPDMQPAAGVGEFLLGSNYPNVYGGANSLGGLSPVLGENATFCALRVMAQDVAGFERLLDEASSRYQVDPDWLAAKLMGRWRNGTPLSQSPDAPWPAGAAAAVNEFDFAPSQAHPLTPDDVGGLRCPVGAHIRRMNPRSATVAGKPYSRRLLRRGLPYGPAHVPGENPPVERGLVGLFLCADLGRQFEFILRQWVQGDRATSGVRGQQDPIIGAQATLHDGQTINQLFRIPRGGGLDDIVLVMPRLVTTLGSVYLFMPGLAGLRFLSQPRVRPAADQAVPVQAPTWTAKALAAADGGPALAAGALPPFDPTSAAFRADPFPVYAAYRAQAPVARFTFGQLDTVWVFDNALVAAVAGNPAVYHKQHGNPHEIAGLLNMDDPGHAACRAALQPLFVQALAAVRQQVPQQVAARFAACQALAQPVDWVTDFADGVARAAFFGLFGLDNSNADDLMDKVEDALKLPSPSTNVSLEAALKACGLKLFTLASSAPAGSLVKQILSLPTKFDAQNPSLFLERYANATVMVLAGVLPAKWAIALATWHLLDNGAALLRALRADPGISDRMAAEELLRFDSSTPMSLRYAMSQQVLNGVTVNAGDRVMVAWASASRDTAQFGANADSVDFTRRLGAGWAFGNAGSFECLGNELVLLILSTVVRTLRTANPLPRLDPGFQPVWSKDRLMFRAMLDLPLHCS